MAVQDLGQHRRQLLLPLEGASTLCFDLSRGPQGGAPVLFNWPTSMWTLFRLFMFRWEIAKAQFSQGPGVTLPGSQGPVGGRLSELRGHH